jgi:transcriptional antiterminator NusG
MQEINEESLNHKWYAILTHAGSEQSVKKAIEMLVVQNGIEEKLGEILVPTEDVIEVKNGKKVITERSLYSGYVFAQIDLDTALWHKIQSLPKVGRFIGESKKPTPLTEKDINLILEKAKKKGAPKPKVSFHSGESVRITEGPFANFTGIVEEYDMEHGKLKLNVSIFGRSTPVEIEYTEVEKII